MIVLILAAIIGGGATLAMLWPWGAVAALAGAPFGGSLAALVASCLLAWRARASNSDEEPEGVSSPHAPRLPVPQATYPPGPAAGRGQPGR